jgi:hypothetical protein
MLFWWRECMSLTKNVLPKFRRRMSAIAAPTGLGREQSCSAQLLQSRKAMPSGL